MANEITISAEIDLDNGDLERNASVSALQFTQAAKGCIWICVNAAASDEAIVTTELTSLGWCYMRNLDATNYVEWGPDNGGSIVPCGRLEAGEVAMFRLSPAITLRTEANTAAVELDIMILED